MQELIQVFGRFHPLVLHAPIGMLGAMAVIETLSLKKPDESIRRIFSGLAWLTALAAIVSVVSGWVLSREGGYDQTTVDRHFNLGLATAVLSVLLAVASHFKAHASPRRGLLVLTLLVLVPTGHFGASMTHGEDFLLEPLANKGKSDSNHAVKSDPTNEMASAEKSTPSMRESPAANVSTAKLTDNALGAAAAWQTEGSEVYTKEIAPIFNDLCVKCHSATKMKGGLALHTPDAIWLGGDSGTALEPGRPEDSEMLIRMRLPVTSKDHMPPKGKPQPTEAQIAAIEAWIKAGAPMPGASANTAAAPDHSHDAKPADSKSTAEIAATDATPENKADAKPSEAEASPTKPAGPAPASAEAITAIRSSLVHVEPLAADSTLLVVSFNAIAPTVDDAMAARLLTPIKDNLADLSLGRTKITDKTLEVLAAMPHLRRLDLRATPITPAGVEKLAKSGSLEELILAQTKLCDDIVPTLCGMTKLSHVYLWSAGVTPESITKLRADRPELEVDAGDRLVTQNLGTEDPLKFSSDAPLPGASISTPATLEPINKVCPVTGNPINPKYLVLYDGKVIGFCCPNCPKEFWANPEACLATLKAK
ncbi:MAG: c-type cytochrome domain-containing protein [Phycisphaerales bacterium]